MFFPAIILVGQQHHRTTSLSQSQSIASPSNEQQVNGTDDEQQQPGQEVDVDLRQEVAAMRSLVNNQSQITRNLRRIQNEHEEEIDHLLKQLKYLTDNRGKSN